MPDTFSVALVLIALFFAYEYLVRGRKMHLVFYFLFASLGILCKLPAIVLLSVLIALPFLKELGNKRKLGIYLSSILAVGISFYWYFIWVPALNEEHGFPLFFPRGIVEGAQLALPYWDGFLSKFYFDSFYAYSAFATFLMGLFFMIKKKNKMLSLVAGTFTLIFLIFALKTGIVFPTHSYYIIPFVPLMALIAGFALEKVPSFYFGIVLTVISAEAIANQQHDFFIKDWEKYKLGLAHFVENDVARDDKIVINGGSSPQHIYFANRKGWTLESEKLLKPNCLDSLQNLGAKYLIWDAKVPLHQNLPYPKIKSNRNYTLYSLDKD
jgi:4-amino-4-deoxy-L-arabinose transferase-like glycosyltransferase